MKLRGKRIAFVDNDLENFHADVFLSAIRGELADRGFIVTGAFGLQEESSRQWAERQQVPYFSSVEKLDEVADVYMVLAPSNPELHLELCKQVLPLRKVTYVDKVFAPNLACAEKIFALGDRYEVPLQTTSALRYTNVQSYLRENGCNEELRHIITWGGGRSFHEYGIHPVELAISCLGPNATRLFQRIDGEMHQLLIDFEGGRSAVVNSYTNTTTPFFASLTTSVATHHIAVEESFFLNTTSAILDFFEAGRPTIDRRESLMIRRILDVATDLKSTQMFVPL